MTSSRPFALITNDDGITSPGLVSLAEAALECGMDVVVAAPWREFSGAGAAINTVDNSGSVEMSRHDLPQLGGVTTFAVRASPALIALIAAHGAFGRTPDYVLSGINRGANVGRAILHSGTVGAALTGGQGGARALATSLDVGMDPAAHHWASARRVVRHVLPWLMEQPAGAVVNLNVPNTPLVEPLEIVDAPLASFGIVQTTMTEHGRGEVQIAVAELPLAGEEGSDAALLAQGRITVTPIVGVRDVPWTRMPPFGVQHEQIDSTQQLDVHGS